MKVMQHIKAQYFFQNYWAVFSEKKKFKYEKLLTPKFTFIFNFN